MARPSALVAGGAASSFKRSAPSRGWLTYVQNFCLQMLAMPTSAMLREANQALFQLADYAGLCVVKALSPREIQQTRFMSWEMLLIESFEIFTGYLRRHLFERLWKNASLGSGTCTETIFCSKNNRGLQSLGTPANSG